MAAGAGVLLLRSTIVEGIGMRRDLDVDAPVERTHEARELPQDLPSLPAVDEHLDTGRSFDKDRIALPHVHERYRKLALLRREKTHEHRPVRGEQDEQDEQERMAPS